MRISDWSSDVCSSDLLHLERKILFHGHEALDTDTPPTLEGEYWLMHNHFAQAEGVANLDKVPEAGALIAIGFAQPLGGVGGYSSYIAIPPDDLPPRASVVDPTRHPRPMPPHPPPPAPNARAPP